MHSLVVPLSSLLLCFYSAPNFLANCSISDLCNKSDTCCCCCCCRNSCEFIDHNVHSRRDDSFSLLLLSYSFYAYFCICHGLESWSCIVFGFSFPNIKQLGMTSYIDTRMISFALIISDCGNVWSTDVSGLPVLFSMRTNDIIQARPLSRSYYLVLWFFSVIRIFWFFTCPGGIEKWNLSRYAVYAGLSKHLVCF